MFHVHNIFTLKVNAGIDTTGNTLAFLLYNMARFPEKQARQDKFPNENFVCW